MMKIKLGVKKNKKKKKKGNQKRIFGADIQKNEYTNFIYFSFKLADFKIFKLYFNLL